MGSVVQLKTKFFFDRPAVMSAMDRAERRSLSRLGAFTRTAARQSIRRRKKASKPGKPPSAHASSGNYASLKKILYVYDKVKSSVVVGPVKLNTGQLIGSSAADTVPQLLEEGGRVTQTLKSRSGKGTYTKRVIVAARPFMGPAKTKAVKDVDKAMENTFY